MPLCPCGSQKLYTECCAVFIENKQSPKTPEQLMRSRYTAYSLANVDYIKMTMKGPALVGFNEQEAKEWALKIIWLNLKVIRSYMETPQKGFVEFVATFKENQQLKTLREISEFHQENNLWYYIDGNPSLTATNTQAKVPRNNPCPCGSGKKFKNCHDK